jgi:hypothetical protein
MKVKKTNIPETLDIGRASEIVKKKIGEALNKKPNATISISKEGDDWKAIVEILEEEYLPGKNLQSMSDIIGVYEVQMSSKGDHLINWTKKSSRKRGS